MPLVTPSGDRRGRLRPNMRLGGLHGSIPVAIPIRERDGAVVSFSAKMVLAGVDVMLFPFRSSPRQGAKHAEPVPAGLGLPGSSLRWVLCAPFKCLLAAPDNARIRTGRLAFAPSAPPPIEGRCTIEVGPGQVYVGGTQSGPRLGDFGLQSPCDTLGARRPGSGGGGGGTGHHLGTGGKGPAKTSTHCTA